jgi:hypothetical protein
VAWRLTRYEIRQAQKGAAANRSADERPETTAGQNGKEKRTVGPSEHHCEEESPRQSPPTQILTAQYQLLTAAAWVTEASRPDRHRIWPYLRSQLILCHGPDRADQDRCEGRQPRTLCRLPNGGGRHLTTKVPGDTAADRGTTAAATAPARSVRLSRAQEQSTGGMRPDARPSFGAAGSPSTPRVRQQGRKSANIRVSLEVIRGNPETSESGPHVLTMSTWTTSPNAFVVLD